MENSVQCARCKAEIGHIVEINGIELLQVGGALARYTHGVCANCGAEVHWSVSDRALERLLVRVMEKKGL